MQAFFEENSSWIALASILAAVFLFLFNLFLLITVLKLKKGLKRFFSGKSGGDFEALITSQTEEIRDMDREIQELFEISNKINGLAQHSLHKVGIIRYNPFRDLGGDQSFVIALLDAKNSGFVISSLHTREGTRVYAKPVAKGESKKYPLTEEEKQAIKIASPAKESRV